MLEQVQADRLAKLNKIREMGIDPYGGRYDSAEPIENILKRYKDGEHGQRADTAGRVVLQRDQGKLIFAHLRDQTGKIQIALRKRKEGAENIAGSLDDRSMALAKLLDLGDLVAVEGILERTRTGEITIWAERLTLLCKSLNPMPEKFHGLQDVETRYRQRYLDLMTNPDSMAVFQKRVAIIENFRERLKKRGFIEVETPILQPIYGGGAARPFTTHHNTLDADLYLRISPELYLKRLLVGGMEKVFEIGRNFRNEGIDTRHNPEFTMMELYQAYADYEVMMEITEELVVTSAAETWTEQALSNEGKRYEDEGRRGLKVLLNIPDEDIVFAESGYLCIERLNESIKKALLSVEDQRRDTVRWGAQWDISLLKRAQGCYKARVIVRSGGIAAPYEYEAVNFTRPWPRKTYADLLQEHAGVAMRDSAAVRKKARELGIEDANKDDAVVINEVFEVTVEPALAKLDHPTFVKDYPAEICPLTRRKADDPSIALRFEVFAAGMELGNAYTELNDPAVQEANFRQQVRGEGDGAAMRKMDEDFVAALRHGMPPAGGLGIGIDRIVMLLTNSQSIRDVVLFPLLRPQT